MGTFTGRHENETTVRKVSAGFVTGDNGWTFAPPGEHLGRFKPGLTYTLETRNLSVVTGCRIDGEWVWRRSDAWLDDDHRVTVAGLNAERAERLRDNRETWEAREAALPAWLRARIEHFRGRAGERFELDGWAYELTVAELAVLYDEAGLAESDAVTAYSREHGTSGNQHGIARLLAGARRNDPEWSAAGSVSALSPITGEPFYVKEPK